MLIITKINHIYQIVIIQTYSLSDIIYSIFSQIYISNNIAI